MWGISSVGRAPALHAGGQEFESPILHSILFSSAVERTTVNRLVPGSILGRGVRVKEVARGVDAPLSSCSDSCMKKIKQHQVKTRWYYVFWGIATLAVTAGQIYVGTGYRDMAQSVNRLTISIQK